MASFPDVFPFLKIYLYLLMLLLFRGVDALWITLARGL
jgi:hypothetical protein